MQPTQDIEHPAPLQTGSQTASPQPLAPPSSIWARIQKLSPYFTHNRKLWVFALGASAIGSLTEAYVPGLMQWIIDKGFGSQGLPILLVAGIVFVMFTFRAIMDFIGEVALAHIVQDGMLRLRQDIFAYLGRAQMAIFGQENASSLSNTIVFEVQNGSQMLVQSMISIVRESLYLIGLFAWLLYLNWQLTLVIAILFPALAWTMRTLSKRLYRLTKESQTATDELAYVVEENVLAHRAIRLHNAQKQQLDRFTLQSRRLRNISVKALTAAAGIMPATTILAGTALAVVMAVALYQSKHHGFSVGSFVGYIMAMLMLTQPIRKLSNIANPITRGLAALERGLHLIERNPLEQSGKATPKPIRGEIAFHNVCLHYAPEPEDALHKAHTATIDTAAMANATSSANLTSLATADTSSHNRLSSTASTKAALEAIHLEVKAGEIVALVGASGSGKTSLVNLLPRFVLPSSGVISIDGISIEDWDLGHLRGAIALVSQDVIMLNDSLAANIALGAQIDEARIRTCLQAANLMDFVATLANGIHSAVGHNASQLSGGQRQRLAIARALYKDAPILILDEATSALDNESERLVQDALARLMQGRTTLIVAHRLSTIEHADRIVVMDAGRIVEVGSHSQLLKQSGRYAQLYAAGMADAAAST